MDHRRDIPGRMSGKGELYRPNASILLPAQHDPLRQRLLRIRFPHVHSSIRTCSPADHMVSTEWLLRWRDAIAHGQSFFKSTHSALTHFECAHMARNVAARSVPDDIRIRIQIKPHI